MAVPTQELTLPDGRKLAWCEYGDLHSTHPPIIYFHSMPSSRYEGSLFHKLALQYSFRIISPDRPGVGISTPDPNRTILSYHTDILQLIQHLEIGQFRVLSISRGGPYAFACLDSIPRWVCLGGQIISSIYPPKLGLKGMAFMDRAAMFVASYAPNVIGTMADLACGAAARNLDPDVLKTKVMKNINSLPERDQKAFEDEEYMTACLDGLRDCFQHGGAGMATESSLTANDWGFELENIDGKGVLIWHGKLDVNCPFPMAEKAAGMMNGVKTKFLDEEAHNFVAYYKEEIMRKFLPAT